MQSTSQLLSCLLFLLLCSTSIGNRLKSKSHPDSATNHESNNIHQTQHSNRHHSHKGDNNHIPHSNNHGRAHHHNHKRHNQNFIQLDDKLPSWSYHYHSDELFLSAHFIHQEMTIYLNAIDLMQLDQQYLIHAYSTDESVLNQLNHVKEAIQRRMGHSQDNNTNTHLVSSLHVVDELLCHDRRGYYTPLQQTPHHPSHNSHQSQPDPSHVSKQQSLHLPNTWNRILKCKIKGNLAKEIGNNHTTELHIDLIRRRKQSKSQSHENDKKFDSKAILLSISISLATKMTGFGTDSSHNHPMLAADAGVTESESTGMASYPYSEYRTCLCLGIVQPLHPLRPNLPLPMLIETIEHHLLLGFHHLFIGILLSSSSAIYQQYLTILLRYFGRTVMRSRISLIPMSYPGMDGVNGFHGLIVNKQLIQELFYNECLLRSKDSLDWMLYLEANEMLVMTPNVTVDDILRQQHSSKAEEGKECQSLQRLSLEVYGRCDPSDSFAWGPDDTTWGRDYFRSSKLIGPLLSKGNPPSERLLRYLFNTKAASHISIAEGVVSLPCADSQESREVVTAVIGSGVIVANQALNPMLTNGNISSVGQQSPQRIGEALSIATKRSEQLAATRGHQATPQALVGNATLHQSNLKSSKDVNAPFWKVIDNHRSIFDTIHSAFH